MQVTKLPITNDFNFSYFDSLPFISQIIIGFVDGTKSNTAKATLDDIDIISYKEF